MTGEIPEELGNLTNLTQCCSSTYNQLTGEIPAELGNLTTAYDLQLHRDRGRR